MTFHPTRSKFATLPPETEIRLFLARHIGGVVGKGRRRPQYPFAAQEAERAGAGVVVDLLLGIGLGYALGHDQAHAGGGLAQGLGQQREGPLQVALEIAIVDGADLVERHVQTLSKAVMLRFIQRKMEAIQSAERTGVSS